MQTDHLERSRRQPTPVWLAVAVVVALVLTACADPGGAAGSGDDGSSDAGTGTHGNGDNDHQGDSSDNSDNSDNGNGDSSGTATDELPQAAFGSWTLQSGSGADGPLPDTPDAPISSVTLTVDETSWGGTAACNSYGGDVRIDADGTVSIADGFFATEMACDPPALMILEQTYLRALGEVTTAMVSGGADATGGDRDQLTLTGGAVELQLLRQQPPADAGLTGTDWVLDSVLTGEAPDDAVSSPPLLDVEVALRFDDDGTLSVRSYCNDLGARWERGPAEHGADEPLTVTLVDATAAGCPAGLQGDEDELLQLLEDDGLTWRIDGELLTLRAADSSALRFRVAP